VQTPQIWCANPTNLVQSLQIWCKPHKFICVFLRLSQEAELLFTFVRVFRIELPSDTWLYFRPLLCPAVAASRGLSSVPTLRNFLAETLSQPWKVHDPSGTPPSPFWLSSTLAHTPPNTAFDHAASLIPAENSTHCLIRASWMYLECTLAIIRLVFSFVLWPK